AAGLALLGAPGEAPGASPADPLSAAGGFFPENCWRVYLTQARAFEALGRAGEADAAYRRAMATVEAMRDRLRSDQWQVAALQDKLDVYQCYIHFLYHADQAANAPAILALAEQLKSRAFLDLLESARLELDDLAPAELRAKRQALLARFSAANTAIAQELRKAPHDEARVAKLLAAQQTLAGEWRELQSAINDAVADRAGELNPPPLDLAAARALLAAEPDLVALSYVVGDDQSYLVVADAGGESVYELPGRAALEFAVGRLVWYAQKVPLRFAEFVAANRAAVAATLGPALADGLLARLAGKRALILPDGMLCYLPFELLLARDPVDAAGQPIDPATYRASGPDKPKHPDELGRDLLPFYLLSHCPVSYAQSLSVWQMLQGQRPQPAADGSAYRALGVYSVNYAVESPKGPGHQRAQELGIAYVDLPQTARIARVLKALDSAGEAEEVLALAAWDENRAPWPLERQSNEGNFKRLLEQHSARYLIFAGHGVFNDKYPSFSGLVFNLATPGAPEAGATASEQPQDGFFGLNDLFGLRMRGTELTFLAACQGGLGMLSRGEGVNAVTRGLMYRGSPSVVASLWCVDVLATMDLVEGFFAELGAAPEADKAQLLQAAKRKLADQPDQPQRAHPFYWAPFVLMGRR
ncbi:MAG TPA: CHAT domain-containing protein, partial [Herpetosiphonaceae bacterium]